jgi:hypothetical protein
MVLARCHCAIVYIIFIIRMRLLVSLHFFCSLVFHFCRCLKQACTCVLYAVYLFTLANFIFTWIKFCSGLDISETEGFLIICRGRMGCDIFLTYNC